MHGTTCMAAECNWSLWDNFFEKEHNCLTQERAEKLILIRQNDDSKMKCSMLTDKEAVMNLLHCSDDANE